MEYQKKRAYLSVTITELNQKVRHGNLDNDLGMSSVLNRTHAF